MDRSPVPRPLAAADLDRATEIEQRVFSDPWSRRSFEELLGQRAVRAFGVDDENGRLIGYGVCSCAADEGEILNLAVEPAARRRGVGAAIVAAMLGRLRSEGVSRVFLEVRRSNDAAIAVYERAGFARLGTRHEYYRNPREDALTMAMELPLGGAGK